MKAIIVSLFLSLSAQAQPVDIYLLAGQSNMVGDGDLQSEPPPNHPHHILMLGVHGYFRPASDPLVTLCPGQAPLGVGPGLWFADRMVELCPPGTYVGVVQCACGGTSIMQWQPWYQNLDLYWNLIKQANRAAEWGKICGLLWYQGEADTFTPDEVALYWQRTINFFRRVRLDLQIPDLPIVFVQLGPSGDGQPYWQAIQLQQAAMGANNSLGAKMVTASDLTTLPASLDHLDTPSQIILGTRLADKMYELSFGP